VLTHTAEEIETAHHQKAGSSGGSGVGGLRIEEYSTERIVARAQFKDSDTRPGGMVAGPVLFALADSVAYFVTISRSPKGSDAFTASISMEFLRPAPVGILTVEGRLLRFGKRLCVVDVAIRSDSLEDLVAHAVVTYAPVFPASRAE
jgi:uncharacterized protein (TIGR00369 family)